MVKVHIALEREDPGVRAIVTSALRVLEDVGGVTIPTKHVEAHSGEAGSNVHYYVQQSLVGERDQVDVEAYGQLLRKGISDPKELHFMLTVLETDMFGGNTNFVFGSTLPLFRHDGVMHQWQMNLVEQEVNFAPSVTVSTWRLRRMYGKSYPIALAALLVHELGHFYGLASDSNPNGIFTIPKTIEFAHCNDPACIMEQVNIRGRRDLRQKAMDTDYDRPFCQPDEQALRKALLELYR